MLPNHEIQNPAHENVITSVRVFNYPVQKVFSAWSQPEHLKQWWGPKGFTNTFHRFNFTEGGTWNFVMHGPDGANYDNESTFVKIEEPNLIVFNHIVSPLFQVQANFKAQGNETKLTFKMVFLSAELCEQLKPVCVPSNEENFDRLEAVLQNMQA